MPHSLRRAGLRCLGVAAELCLPPCLPPCLPLSRLPLTCEGCPASQLGSRRSVSHPQLQHPRFVGVKFRVLGRRCEGRVCRQGTALGRGSGLS